MREGMFSENLKVNCVYPAYPGPAKVPDSADRYLGGGIWSSDDWERAATGVSLGHFPTFLSYKMIHSSLNLQFQVADFVFLFKGKSPT